MKIGGGLGIAFMLTVAVSSFPISSKGENWFLVKNILFSFVRLLSAVDAHATGKSVLPRLVDFVKPATEILRFLTTN